MWPDDSSFLLCNYGVLLCSTNVYTSIPCMQNRAKLLSEVRIFKIYQAKILGKFKFFSLNAVTSILEIVFEPKIGYIAQFSKNKLSFLKCAYATSCSYVLSLRSGNLTVSISVTMDDII